MSDMSGVITGSKVSADQKTRDVPKGDGKRGADGGSESLSVRWRDNTQEGSTRGKDEVGMMIQERQGVEPNRGGEMDNIRSGFGEKLNHPSC